MAILKKVGLPHLKAALASEEVTITELLRMTDEDLRKTGVEKLLHRRRIIAAANEYKEKKEKDKGK